MSKTVPIVISLLLVSVAAQSEIVKLGQPCRAKNVLASRLVTDRKTGKEWFVLSNMNEHSNMELIFIDFERNVANVYRAPAGAGAWGLIEVPGDRLVVSTFYDGNFMVFDLNKMEFVKVASFPGEDYIWTMAIGSDGRVYGGTYPGGKLGALDLNTYEVEDLGAPAKPNLYCRHVSALPDGRLLCNFIQEKTMALIYDPSTKEFSPVPESMKDIGYGISWNGYFLSGAKVFDGKTLEAVTPPFPVPPPDKGGWVISTTATTDDVLVLSQGSTIYVYRKGEKSLERFADVERRGSGIAAVTRDGRMLGVRGQDYFVLKKGDRRLNLRQIPAESSPRETHFLRLDDRNRLWGGPTFGQTLWWMDLLTGRTVNTSTVCNSGGEVYDVAFRNGETYAVAYAGGDIIRYNADKPWNQWDNVNPKTIASVGPRGYIRPIAGAVFGPDGKLYSGWMASYGKYGGAIAITDPETGETDLIENPLGEQAIAGIAPDERFIYAGTSIGGNGLPNKANEWASFGVIHRATKKVVFKRTFDKVRTIRVLGYDPESKRVVLATDGTLKLFDRVKRVFLDLPADTPELSSHSTSMRDGILVYGSDQYIVKLDVRKAEFTRLVEGPGKISNVAAAPDGTVYFSSGVDVYAFKPGK